MEGSFDQSGVMPQSDAFDDAGITATPAKLRSKIVIIAILGVAILCVAIFFGIGPKASPSAGAAAAVRRALTSTLSRDSMALDVQDQISVGGQTVPVTGTAACEIKVATCAMSLTYGGFLSSLGAIPVIVINGTMYMKVGGALSEKIPTLWLSTPVVPEGSSSPSLGMSGSPLAGLAVLAREGAVVTDEGEVSVDGKSMRRYYVVIDAKTNRELLNSTTLKIAPWLKSAAKSTTFGDSTVTIDVDAAGQIGQVSVQVSANEYGQKIYASSVTTVTAYGVPVDAVAPPADQVTSISKLTGSLQ